MRYHDFKISTHEVTLKTFPEIGDFKKLIHAVWHKRAEPVRLIGLGCHLKTDKSNEENPDSETQKNSHQLVFKI